MENIQFSEGERTMKCQHLWQPQPPTLNAISGHIECEPEHEYAFYIGFISFREIRLSSICIRIAAIANIKNRLYDFLWRWQFIRDNRAVHTMMTVFVTYQLNSNGRKKLQGNNHLSLPHYEHQTFLHVYAVLLLATIRASLVIMKRISICAFVSINGTVMRTPNIGHYINLCNEWISSFIKLQYVHTVRVNVLLYRAVRDNCTNDNGKEKSERKKS